MSRLARPARLVPGPTQSRAHLPFCDPPAARAGRCAVLPAHLACFGHAFLQPSFPVIPVLARQTQPLPATNPAAVGSGQPDAPALRESYALHHPDAHSAPPQHLSSSDKYRVPPQRFFRGTFLLLVPTSAS